MVVLIMKINDKEIDGIIFDLDGTLFDSCSMWHQIDIDFFKKRGMIIPNDYAEAIAHLGLKKAASYTKCRFNFPETVEEIIKRVFDRRSIVFKFILRSLYTMYIISLFSLSNV